MIYGLDFKNCISAALRYYGLIYTHQHRGPGQTDPLSGLWVALEPEKL